MYDIGILDAIYPRVLFLFVTIWWKNNDYLSSDKVMKTRNSYKMTVGKVF